MLNKREKKRERLSAEFTVATERSLRRYPFVPSPRGASWLMYVDQQMRLIPTSMNAFATRKYGRLLLDKYIQSNRENDENAKRITNNEPSVVMMGNAELSPNRPIGIKKNKRCPGVRKLVTSIYKLGHSSVLYVDEYFTSQTCANCFSRFDRNTRRNRFKICKKCKPTTDDIENACLPNKIVTQLSKKVLKKARAIQKMFNRNRHGVPVVNGKRLVSKVAIYYKNWEPTVQGELRGTTVVWHRDIVAARCILYKGNLQTSIRTHYMLSNS